MPNIYDPREALTNPQGDALVEEMRHWNVTVEPSGNVKLTLKPNK